MERIVQTKSAKQPSSEIDSLLQFEGDASGLITVFLRCQGVQLSQLNDVPRTTLLSLSAPRKFDGVRSSRVGPGMLWT
ncbi:hypothetical protein CH292_26575 [Rhodococcus sp. 14-2470-1a]|nr:hypothetical protein CH292_26575 [Rhodococcus sp. 14-2470-1a]